MSARETHSRSSPLEVPTASGDALLDLERLLVAESGFLARLDLAGIDAIAERKEQLLGALGRVVPLAEDRQRLLRIREHAIQNQLLTVHARDAIAAIVFSATPANNVTYAPNERPQSRPGLRLSVRV
jgi:hypothetical protein